MLKKIKEFYFENKIKILLIFFFCIFFIFFCIYINYKYKDNNISEIKEIALQEEKEINNNIKENIMLYVDIKGEVENPGVYEVEDGSIVNDVILSAGGLKKEANTKYINLSKKVENEMVIIVYSNTEIEKYINEEKMIEEPIPCICEEIINDSCISSQYYNSNFSDSNISIININTASVDELDTLSGIGTVKAEAIVEYRTQNGNFKEIEEIKNVSGISESIYTKIKDFITTK